MYTKIWFGMVWFGGLGFFWVFWEGWCFGFGVFCFGLSVRKLELWTLTLTSGDRELCYV